MRQPLPSRSPQPVTPGVPPGAPAWVDGELLAETIRVWQPYYAAALTPEDALAMILGVARLFDVVTSQPRGEPTVVPAHVIRQENSRRPASSRPRGA